MNNGTFDGIYGDNGWLAPDGQFVGEEAAFQQVPAGVQDAGQWLLDNGWKMAALGVPASKAGQLAALDTVGFIGVALVAGLGTVAIVDRRRPV